MFRVISGIIFVSVLALLAAGCGASATSTPRPTIKATSTPIAAATATLQPTVQATATLLPTTTAAPTATATPVPTAMATATPPASTMAAPGATLTISTDGDNLKFDKAELTAKAGEDVVLKFTNNSSALQHNWVLVKAGTKDAVADAGTAAGPANNWVPTGDESVIAHMALVDPGKVGEVRFTAPAAGTYQFLCTFPGHNAAGMFGEFVVEP